MKKLKVFPMSLFSSDALRKMVNAIDKDYIQKFIEVSPFNGNELVDTAFGPMYWLIDQVSPGIMKGHRTGGRSKLKKQYDRAIEDFANNKISFDEMMDKTMKYLESDEGKAEQKKKLKGGKK